MKTKSEIITQFRQKRKRDLITLYGGKCSLCGYNKSIKALEFHHIKPQDKKYALGTGNCHKLQDDLTEAKKCLLVCANCHREIHDGFYNDAPFQSLDRFTEIYYRWYSELAQNKRAFAPLHYDNQKQMGGWIKGVELDAKDDSYYLLSMIEASNKDKSKEHSNKFRYFLQFVFDAIDKYTNKIYRSLSA